MTAWEPADGDKHTDNLEMAGALCVDEVTYGINENGMVLYHCLAFPTLRKRPNDTMAAYRAFVLPSDMPRLLVNGRPCHEKLLRCELDGTLRAYSKDMNTGTELFRRCFPSVKHMAAYELITVTNSGDSPMSLTVDRTSGKKDELMGVMGTIVFSVLTTFRNVTLSAGESFTYAIIMTAGYANAPTDYLDPEAEYFARLAMIEELTSPVRMDTGNDVLDTMFRFCNLRSCESVYDTKSGPMHSPGGWGFYAAVWCNDECEYTSPYFAYTGNKRLIEAAMTSYRLYMPFMSDSYSPIPFSIISEGVDHYEIFDRGDAAMYLYGATRFALTSGDRQLSEELLPAIEWCAEYCRRKTTEDGVVASHCDELENRFPAGKANLSTSCLAYSGYLKAAILERELGRPEKADEYDRLADNLRAAIDRHFGAEIHGFRTYRYYAECDHLRAWIGLPLAVGIYDRAEETVKALISEYEMNGDEVGFLTKEGDPTVWDRSTMYDLRGFFKAGETEAAYEILEKYCESRLLGERVPYVIELNTADGCKRHLSGESPLFLKVFIEGIAGLEPTGLHSFSLMPRLPEKMDHLYLRNIHAFGGQFDILIEKDNYRVVDAEGKTLGEGGTGGETIVHVR